jgi:hypothetical protein
MTPYLKNQIHTSTPLLRWAYRHNGKLTAIVAIAAIIKHL